MSRRRKISEYLRQNSLFALTKTNLLLHKKFKFYFTTYESCGDSLYPHGVNNRVNYVTCVESDAKVDARRGVIPFKSTHDLKCTKIGAKKDEKIGMNLLKSPFFDDRKKSFT